MEILRDARDEAERVITELKQAKSARQEDINASRKALSDKIGEAASHLLTKPEAKSGTRPEDLKVGDAVQLLSHDVAATVLKAPKDGSVYVQAGALKLTVPLSDVAPAKPEKKVKSIGGFKRSGESPGMSVDLRGLSLDEAVMQVDIYLDEVFLAGQTEVLLIHGKGTGVLRSGLRQYLKNHTHVKSYRGGQYGEGEDGVTVVTLK
jgi:DNA mismatch repair protein MutS2